MESWCSPFLQSRGGLETQSREADTEIKRGRDGGEYWKVSTPGVGPRGHVTGGGQLIFLSHRSGRSGCLFS